jgi:hypothetical protein
VVDIPGYITEKIFDCFFTGCVPVYLGANNIKEHIPFDCFIDFRNFTSYEKLYEHLCSIDSIQFAHYQNEAALFLNSEYGKKFSSSYFAKTIVDHVCK